MALVVLMAGSALAQYKIGDKAKDFSLKGVDGKQVSLAGIKGAKGYVVVFTCNHCPWAKLYEDRLVKMSNKLAKKGWYVVAINSNDEVSHPDDSYDKMIARAKEKGFTFPYLRDESQEVAKAYGAEKTPHAFVVENKGGELIVRYMGGIDDNPGNENSVKKNYIEDAIEAITAGKEVPVTVTKATGCGIKWKKA